MESTFVECKECKKHWFNGTEIEMCDNDWKCEEHEHLHRTKDVCTITWHSYPSEKPKESGLYLVTVMPRLEKTVSCATYHIALGWTHFSDDMVMAFAELPKPYEGEA